MAASMQGTGRMAVVVPHGVLFRGGYVLSEVGVDGDQNAIVSSGYLEKLPVARVQTQRSGLDCVLALPSQPVGQAATGTPINEES